MMMINGKMQTYVTFSETNKQTCLSGQDKCALDDDAASATRDTVFTTTATRFSGKKATIHSSVTKWVQVTECEPQHSSALGIRRDLSRRRVCGGRPGSSTLVLKTGVTMAFLIAFHPLPFTRESVRM